MHDYWRRVRISGPNGWRQKMVKCFGVHNWLFAGVRCWHLAPMRSHDKWRRTAWCAGGPTHNLKRTHRQVGTCHMQTDRYGRLSHPFIRRNNTHDRNNNNRKKEKSPATEQSAHRPSARSRGSFCPPDGSRHVKKEQLEDRMEFEDHNRPLWRTPKAELGCRYSPSNLSKHTSPRESPIIATLLNWKQ